LRDFDDEFQNIIRAEEDFPPVLPDMKDIYNEFYHEITDLSRDFVCASCGCIHHHADKVQRVPVDNPSLLHLQVDPSIVPFDFGSGIPHLDLLHIMIDPTGIAPLTIPSNTQQHIFVCRTCNASLEKGYRPRESLANYRWIGAVPPELQDLSWIEELLIARAHLTGQILRLQNRNSSSHFGLKGHVILLPQDTTELLNILPLPSSSLPDIVRVVWVGRPVRNADVLRDHFRVRTQKVYDALRWLVRNNEDYKDVVIDNAQFERWPPVWVPDELLDLAETLQDGSDEDNARMGIATVDVDTPEVDGNLHITATGIVDIEGVSRPSELDALQHISLWKSNKAINVLTGNNILSEQNLPSYFTSAFPTIFPWGTCKHIDDRRPNRGSKPRLDLKLWMQLLIRNSSRYPKMRVSLADITDGFNATADSSFCATTFSVDDTA
jgi:hypothetical protein